MTHRLLCPAALLLLAFPAAAEQVTALLPPLDIAAWDRARDAARLAREFEHNDLAAADDPPLGRVLDWSFQLKEGAFADIFLRHPLREPFERLRLRVRNLGGPLTLAVKVADAGGAEWTANQVALPAGGDWQVVEFPFARWQVASWSKDANGQLDFPATYLAVIAFGVKPGPSYRLQLAEVSLVRPDPVPATLETTNLPARLDAGAAAEVTLRLTPRAPLPADGYTATSAGLVLQRDGGAVQTFPVTWNRPPAEWRPGGPVTGRASITLSRWQAGGAHTWTLQLPGVALLRADGSPQSSLGEVTVMGRDAKPPRVAVRPHHGAPTIFINDRPVPAMAYAAYGPTPEVFRDFAAAGVRLFSIMGTPTAHGYGLSADTWLEPERYDYRQLDERIRMVLDQYPEAYLFPRLYVSAPQWWLDQHPDAVVLYDPGDGKPVPFLQNGKRVPSWSSPAWRAATQEALRKLIAHVEAQPYAERVMGYHIASGTTEEWMMWGANDDAWTDCSPDNTAAFRRWLTARYRDDAGLRAAWGDPAVTLATATVPTRKQRATSTAGVLRDPATDTPSIDYVRYIADMTAETIDLLCATAKEAAGGQRLAGVFYGYLLQLFGQRQQNAAHLGFDAVVRSPNVDFLCSPTSYAFRALGTGTSHFMAPLGSVLAHGKLWFDENDIRTSLAPGNLGEWGKPADVAGDLRQQDRELANVLVHGAGQWWFDVGRNRYDDPTLLAHLKHLGEVAAQTLEFDRSPADQVALVVDGRGLANVNVGDPLMGELMLQQVPTLARCGAAVGHYELHDVDRLARHRLILFAPLYEPTADQLAALDRLKGEGRVLVFTHLPAPYGEGRWDPAQVERVTGFKLAVQDRQAPVQVTMQGDDPLVRGLGAAIGSDRPTRPVVVGADPAATVLGTLADGSPGLLVRRYPTWTAVWSAAPNLPAAFLARLAEAAGAHRYVTGPDVVWASKELLAVSVDQPGPRTITLPAPARVTDLYEGKLVSERAERFEADFAAAQTRLWRVEAR